MVGLLWGAPLDEVQPLGLPVSHPLNASSRTDGGGQRVYLWIRGHDLEDPTQLRQPAQGPSSRGPFFMGAAQVVADDHPSSVAARHSPTTEE